MKSLKHKDIHRFQAHLFDHIQLITFLHKAHAKI
jgi:hypothetical protein